MYQDKRPNKGKKEGEAIDEQDRAINELHWAYSWCYSQKWAKDQYADYFVGRYTGTIRSSCNQLTLTAADAWVTSQKWFTSPD